MEQGSARQLRVQSSAGAVAETGAPELRVEGLVKRYTPQVSIGPISFEVMEPRVILFDEPLSNLDLKLRLQMRRELRELQRRLGKTTIYVTHDQTEALALSDRIAVLSHGRIEQVGTPREIY